MSYGIFFIIIIVLKDFNCFKINIFKTLYEFKCLYNRLIYNLINSY